MGEAYTNDLGYALIPGYFPKRQFSEIFIYVIQIPALKIIKLPCHMKQIFSNRILLNKIIDIRGTFGRCETSKLLYRNNRRIVMKNNNNDHLVRRTSQSHLHGISIILSGDASPHQHVIRIKYVTKTLRNPYMYLQDLLGYAKNFTFYLRLT